MAKQNPRAHSSDDVLAVNHYDDRECRMQTYMQQKQLLCTTLCKKALLCVLLLTCFLASCENSPLEPDTSTSLTFWHVYGAQTHSPMNELVREFNRTEGKKHGIIINVTSVSNSSAIHKTLVAAAKREPGAAVLPDLFACYPKTLQAMGPEQALDWKKYFTKEELAAFVPQFLEEGTFNGQLKIFPLAKSSNVLFINDGIFQNFAKDTGHSYADLATLEGFFEVAHSYYKWSGGKPFFMYDEWLQYPMLNVLSQGEAFFKDDQIIWDSPAYKKAMRPLARAAIRGEVCLMKGFATVPIMIGEAIAGVESSASVLYFKDEVTHSNNKKVPLQVKSIAEPRLSGAKRIDIQRGGGLGAIKSTPEKEKAAAIFCKWLVSKEKNLAFVTQGGYMPVRQADFAKLESDVVQRQFPHERYKSLYAAILSLKKDSTFIPAPSFEAYGEMEHLFSAAIREVFSKNHQAWLNKEDSLENLVEKSLQQIQEKVSPQ